MAKHAQTPAPMEALLAAELPEGEGWQYEPKWDGFRALARRDGEEVALISRSGKQLGRYFPEVLGILRSLKERHFLLDGELIITVGGALSFEALQLRLHPAESRVRRLAGETPAELMVFDLLEAGGKSLLDEPLVRRRDALERFHAKNEVARPAPFTRHYRPRRGASTGCVAAAARSTGSSPSGSTSNTVPASGRWSRSSSNAPPTASSAAFATPKKSRKSGSLLLGLYDDQGLLDHVGFTSAIPAKDRPALTKKLEKLIEPPGFTGNAPGGPEPLEHRTDRQWQPLKPVLVAEVRYDQVTGRRFRHGTGFLRWRPDKDPKECTFDQLAPELRPSELKELFSASRSRRGTRRPSARRSKR